MSIECINDVKRIKAEAERFLNRIRELESSEWYADKKAGKYNFRSKELGAVKRAAMDLRQELLSVYSKEPEAKDGE